MNVLSIDVLPVWAMLVSLSAHLAAGIVLGVLYFRSLWWTARQFAEGGRAATTIALMLGRFALLAGLLTLASLEGALPLLVMTLGVLIARSAVVDRAWELAP